MIPMVKKITMLKAWPVIMISNVIIGFGLYSVALRTYQFIVTIATVYSDWQRNTTIYVITPTYTRPVQKAELTRLGQTLMHVANLHWILVEDKKYRTSLVKNFVTNINLNITHLFVPDYDPNSKKGFRVPRGVAQRNAGIEWLMSRFTQVECLANNCSNFTNGIVYFADDDNSYDIRLFEAMRKIKQIGVCPVGLVGGLYIEWPELNVHNKVIGFDVQYMRGKRKFGIDMAGFAINLKEFLKNRKVRFVMEHPPEETFLDQFGFELRDLEPFAMNLNEVLVWHTESKKPNLWAEPAYKNRTNSSSNYNMYV